MVDPLAKIPPLKAFVSKLLELPIMPAAKNSWRLPLKKSWDEIDFEGDDKD